MLGKLPPPYIGPAVATEILLNSELKDHYQLIHFDTSINKDLSGFGKKDPAKVFRIWQQRSALKKLLKTERPDLVIVPISQTTSGFYKDAVFVKMAAKYAGKVLVQLRGSNFLNWFEEASTGVQRFVTKTLNQADGVVVLGENLRYLFEPFFSKEKIFVVPNGADYQIPKEKREHEKCRLLYLSNFVPGKGFLELIRALGKIKDGDWDLDAYGAWYVKDYEVQCRNEIEELGLTAKIHLHDVISGEEKYRALGKADVFVFTPKDPEGHPWALVEATAAGLPIIATDRGAIRNSVEDGKNGFLLTDPELEKLAEALTKLLEDRNLREQMANASEELYRGGFTEQHMIHHWKETINKVLRN